MNFLHGNFQSLCVRFWGPLATKKILMPVYLSARSLLLETVGNWGLKDEDREKAGIQARAEVLAAGTSRSLPMDLGWGTARLGKPCPGRRLNKESPEDVRSLLSGALCVSGEESGGPGTGDQLEKKAS